MLPLDYYLILSAIIFAIGVTGVLIRRNLIVVLMSIELMLNAVNLTFIAFSNSLGSMDGQVIVFFVMAVAAAEAVVGLAIIISVFRHRQSLDPLHFLGVAGRVGAGLAIGARRADAVHRHGDGQALHLARLLHLGAACHNRKGEVP